MSLCVIRLVVLQNTERVSSELQSYKTGSCHSLPLMFADVMQQYSSQVIHLPTILR